MLLHFLRGGKVADGKLFSNTQSKLAEIATQIQIGQTLLMI